MQQSGIKNHKPGSLEILLEGKPIEADTLGRDARLN